MKFWRLDAQRVNAERARIIEANAYLPREQRQPVPPVARVQKVQTEHFRRVLDKGIKSNWLVAGLLGNLDWDSVAYTLITYGIPTKAQAIAIVRGGHPQAVL